MKNFALRFLPVFVQNILISIYNTYQYKVRHGGGYKKYFEYYSGLNDVSALDVEREQNLRLQRFLDFSVNNSKWYSQSKGFESLSDFSVLEKDDILNNFDDLATLDDKKGIVSLTGGTTGSSMKVVYTREDMQERFAILDSFRASYGYKLGKKTAWFSGKTLVREKDIERGICYRDDWINNIRFFSTFHINEENFEAYWNALSQFSPQFLVGFPSSVYEICKIAKSKGLKYEGIVEVFFPTAETILPVHSEVISEVLGCKLVDQYASSEGAPFILECSSGNKHIHPLTGIFEVVNENLEPAIEGEILVTSFTTHGTPLIRYRIGDRIRLSPPGKKCSCGSSFPLVESIDGRTSDFVILPNGGKVNLGNLSNSTKDVEGIICFQVIQNDISKIVVKVVGSKRFDNEQEDNFVFALRQRVGLAMTIEIERVDEISREKSGKFRIVKNNVL